MEERDGGLGSVDGILARHVTEGGGGSWGWCRSRHDIGAPTGSVFSLRETNYPSSLLLTSYSQHARRLSNL